MKKIVLLILFFINSLFADTPVVFIGTYAEKNGNLEGYLYPSNKKSTKTFDHWALSSYTEKILNTKYKNKLKEANIVLKNDFNENIEKYLSAKNNIRSRKIAFFHLDSFQNNIVLTDKTANSVITFNLTLVQIGEEPNRMTSQNTFESRYTTGETIIVQTKLDEKYTLDKIYKKGFESAIDKLLNRLINNKEQKEVTNLASFDIPISIEYFRISDKIKKLAKEIFQDEENAKRQLLNMFQNNLIQKIRANENLNDIVLLYPNDLNKYLFRNWEEYLTRINEVSKNTLKDENAEIVIRTIKPICEEKQFDGRYKYINGYKIQAFLSGLSDKEAKEESTKNIIYKMSYSSSLARVILPIKKDIVYDGLSYKNNIIKKPEIFAVEASDGYTISRDMNVRRDYEIMSILKKAIDKLSTKSVEKIEKIVKQRPKVFVYENLCKGL